MRADFLSKSFILALLVCGQAYAAEPASLPEPATLTHNPSLAAALQPISAMADDLKQVGIR